MSAASSELPLRTNSLTLASSVRKFSSAAVAGSNALWAAGDVSDAPNSAACF